MPKLNFTTPLHSFSSGNLTYEATKKCYLMGSLYASSSNTTVKINDVTICAIGSIGSGTTDIKSNYFIPPLELAAGDRVVLSNAATGLRVYDVAS